MRICEKIFLKKSIKNFRHNNNDDKKNPDVLFEEDGITKGIQITQLQFTNHVARKALADKKSQEIADSLARIIHIQHPVIINIFPSTKKDIILLSIIKKGREKIEKALINFIANILKGNSSVLSGEFQPIHVEVENKILSPNYKFIALNYVPKNGFPRFNGKGNIYINYDFDDAAYEENDIVSAIDAIYVKKK